MEKVKLQLTQGLSNSKPWKPNSDNILGNWDDYKEIQRLYGITVEEETEPPTDKSLVKKAVAINAEKESKQLPEAVNDEEKKRKEMLKKLFVFQKYRELREENALENWRRHCIEWNQVEELLSQKSGRVHCFSK
jgi:hypothetical protein